MPRPAEPLPDSCSCSALPSTPRQPRAPVRRKQLGGAVCREYRCVWNTIGQQGRCPLDDETFHKASQATPAADAMSKSRCCDDDFSALSTGLRCLLAVVIVLVVLTAVFLPLYYFVFRPYFGHLWTTVFGPPVSGVQQDDVSPQTPIWQPQCPEDPVLEWNRFDCYPEDPDVDSERCEERGCCWVRTPIDAALEKERLGKWESFRDTIPKCIFPRNYGYVISGPEEPLFGGFELPLRRIAAPSRYGDDIVQLKVRVEMQTPYRLRIKIYDPSDDRYEVPDPLIPVEPQLNTNGRVQMYATSYNLGDGAFHIKVRRAETGAVL